MADQQTERFLRNQRERHLEQARVAARRIQDRVANILRDLEAGRPPSEFSLVPDAVELEKRAYLLDGLTAIGSDVARVAFTEPGKPALITGAVEGDGVPDYRYLLMPIRLGG